MKGQDGSKDTATNCHVQDLNGQETPQSWLAEVTRFSRPNKEKNS